MALIKCPECETEISDKAEMCPKCGFPVNKEAQGNVLEKVKNIDKNKLKKYIIVAITIIAIIVIGKGFIHPNLQFEDFVFGDARVSALLGYSTGTDGNEKYWDNCVKFYDIKVDHLTYEDGWYWFYFSEDKKDEVRQIISDYCDYSGVSSLYYDESEELAVWWEGQYGIGEYRDYYVMRVAKSKK